MDGHGILISFRSGFGPFQWLSLSLSWEYDDNDNGCRHINHGFCWICQYYYMEVSWNGGTPRSSILIGFSMINQPFGGTPMTMETSIFPEEIPHFKSVFPVGKINKIKHVIHSATPGFRGWWGFHGNFMRIWWTATGFPTHLEVARHDAHWCPL